MSTSSSGYEDGFGRRVLAFDRTDGVLLERLYLRPEFAAFEPALTELTARAAAIADERLIAPLGLDRDEITGELVLVSPFGGDRLSDVVDASTEPSDETAAPGLDVALGFTLNMLGALESLRANTGYAHGTLAPSRVIITPTGRLALTEWIFAPLLPHLNLTRRRLWREFRIVTPPVAGATRFDETGDLSQTALMAVALVLGRPLDAPEMLLDMLAEVIEIAQIRGSASFAVGLQRFLQRALPLPGRRPYQTLEAALGDAIDVASKIGLAGCISALHAFTRLAVGVDADEESDEAALAAAAAYELRTPPAIEPVAVREPAFTAFTERFEPPVPEFVPPAAAAEPVVFEPLAAAPEFIDPIPVVAPQVVEPSKTTHIEIPRPVEITRVEPAPVAAMPVTPVPVEPAPQPMPEPIQVPESKRAARRRRSRDRDPDDVLHSATVKPVAPPPAPQPEPAPIALKPVAPPPPPPPAPEPEPAPVVVKPLPPPPRIVVPPAPVIPQPVFTQIPVAPSTVPIATAPASPYAGTSIRLTAAEPVRLKSQAPAPVRMKPEPPSIYAPAPPRYDRPVFTPPAATPSQFSWKFLVSAAMLIVSAAVAGVSYRSDRGADSPSRAKTTARTTAAPAPTAVATGIIEANSEPAGAKVLLDGAAVGETPLRIDEVAPGRHVLTFTTPSATVKKTVRIEAGKTITIDVPVFSGFVAVFAPIVLQVSENGRSIGSTDNGRLLLSPGRHTLTLTNQTFGYTVSQVVDIDAGEVKSLNLDPRGVVNLNATPWAEVWVDGHKVGDTPLANLELPLGNREIVFKHPQYGERKVMTTVTAAAPVAVTIDLTKPQIP